MELLISEKDGLRPIQLSVDKIYNTKRQRLIEGWAFVEGSDDLSIAHFKKSMPVLMSKSGTLTGTQRNIPIGRILNYSFEPNPKNDKMGMVILAEVHKATKFDDHIWEKIKSGELGSFNVINYEKYDEILGISLSENSSNSHAVITQINFLAE